MYVQTESSLLNTIFQNTDSLSFAGLLIKCLYALNVIDFLWSVATPNLIKQSRDYKFKLKFSKTIQVEIVV
jgi:hypothetical protein